MTTRTTLLAVVVAAMVGCVSVSLSLTHVDAASFTATSLPVIPEAAVDAAIASPLIRFNKAMKGGAYTWGAFNGGGQQVMALAAMQGSTRADARLKEQIQYTLTATNGLTCNGGYPSQHEKHLLSMFALLRLTPRLWDAESAWLSDEQRTKITLLVTACTVASAFVASDANPFVVAGTQQYTLDSDSNMNRGWNPNFKEGMIGNILVCMVFWGGHVETTQLLDTFDHAAFVADLSAHNLVNAHATFTWRDAHPTSNAPTAAQIMAAVKDYRYLTHPLSEYWTGIYKPLLEGTWGKPVTAGLNDGAGINGAGRVATDEGVAGVPNVGECCMLSEFDAQDAGGKRSSIGYAYDGYRPHQTGMLTLAAGGYWPAPAADGSPDPVAADALKRLDVGVADVEYKLEIGYVNYSKGKGATAAADMSGHGQEYVLPVWHSVLRPFLVGSGDGGGGDGGDGGGGGDSGDGGDGATPKGTGTGDTGSTGGSGDDSGSDGGDDVPNKDSGGGVMVRPPLWSVFGSSVSAVVVTVMMMAVAWS